MTAQLSIKNVSKRFGAHQALDRVSVEVISGESLAILGPSGCGKTTLLRLIAGLDNPRQRRDLAGWHDERPEPTGICSPRMSAT